MCGTADGYAMNDLNQFVKEKPDREFLESWLKWWDNRREFIFNEKRHVWSYKGDIQSVQRIATKRL